MKRILVIRGISAYDVLGRAADEICEGFRKCGYQVDMIGATDPGADDRFIECLEHRDQYAFYFPYRRSCGIWKAKICRSLRR